MSKRRRHKKTLGISNKGWDTIGKGFKWWLIAGGVALAVVVVGGVAFMAVGSSMMGGAPVYRRALPPIRVI